MHRYACTVLLLSSLGLPASLAAANIVFDTSAGTINGVASGGTFNGTTFTTHYISNNLRQFRFQGDLVIDNGTRLAQPAAGACRCSAPTMSTLAPT